jgi:soluble lytic murein transglycosylase
MKIRFIVSAVILCLVFTSCNRAVNTPENTQPLTPTPGIIEYQTPTPSITPFPTSTPTPIPDERLHIGDLALVNEDWEKALSEYHHALESSTNPDHQSETLLKIGRTNQLAGNFYEAASVLERLIQDYPDSPHIAYANFYLGQAYSGMERYSDAAHAYLNYLVLRPGIIDAYILDLRGDALFYAGDYPSAAIDYQASLNSPSILDGTNLEMKLARSYALSGDYLTALELYDDLYYQTNDENIRALIHLRKGGSYAALGRNDEAISSYMDSINNYPTSYNSYLALIELVDAGVEVDEYTRGIVDYYAGQYGVALAAFNRYRQNNPEDPASGLYYYGLTTSALGGYEEAIENWEKIINNYSDHDRWDDAWEEKAFTQWYNLSEYSQSIQTLLDFVETAPTHPRAPEFLFDAGLVAERDGDFEQAAGHWERVINHYPGYEHALRALFLAGISRYRIGDYQGALTDFLRHQTLSSTLEEKAAAYLWMGKVHSALGDEDAALTSWEQAAGTDPTGYYSERARDLYNGFSPFTPPQQFDISTDLNAERIKAESWLRTTFGLTEDTNLTGLGSLSDNPHIQRGSELYQLGLVSDARAEFEHLRMSLVTDAAQTYRLTNYLLELGIYRSAILAVRQILDLALMDDAETITAPAFFNHVRFGTYFSDLVLSLAEDYGLNPLFLFSVIRQESLFESFIRSPAGAVGLMQIMPATGEEIAQNLGWPTGYSERDLVRPLVNITYGADYLDTQRNYFDEDLYATLAAYNGGPGNTIEWRKLAQEDPDLFLEVIRFPETRNYIRSIYEVFNIYRYIYDRTP